MAKLIVFDMMSVDGYFAGLQGEIDWHVVDEEFNQFAIEQLKTVGTLLFGRVTYDLMASYWPTPTAIKNDPIVAEAMNSKPKIVFSETPMKPDWNNTTYMQNTDKVPELKKLQGKDLIIFGSGILVQFLTNLHLIDEYRLMVNPVILGEGKPLFKDVHEKLHLKLVNTRTFRSGNVLLYYQPVEQKIK